MDVKKQYDKIGKDYCKLQEQFFSKKIDWSHKTIELLLPNLVGKKVLDLGCGYGRAIKLYESLGAKDNYGVDVCKNLIEEGKKLVSKPQNLFVANMEKMPFENGFFDVVVGRFSLHYLKNFEKAYREIARVMKSGAILILIVHHPIYDLIRQKKKNYGKQEIIIGNLFNNKIKLQFPSHTLWDYFSKEFFNKFQLVDFVEGQGLAELRINDFKVPTFMAIKAIKK
ncbi:MAG: class I SAM-dependent methyltransferase [Candidatus ainarchaeum sp.]|nr:class I SAM-dependent methyltransferase [Candidatus ainarchaeum sp.]